MANLNNQVTNALFILSEKRIGKKYGKMLALIIIPDPSIRDGQFPSVSGYHVNFVNSMRWVKNRHNNTTALQKYTVCPMVDGKFVLDSEDFKKVNELKNDFDEKYPTPTNLTEVDKWILLKREYLDEPKNKLIEELYEQDSK
jgi:hypothetical protein